MRRRGVHALRRRGFGAHFSLGRMSWLDEGGRRRRLGATPPSASPDGRQSPWKSVVSPLRRCRVRDAATAAAAPPTLAFFARHVKSFLAAFDAA